MQSVGGDAEAKAPELSGAPRRLALLRSFAPALACIGRVVFDAPDGERGERGYVYAKELREHLSYLFTGSELGFFGVSVCCASGYFVTLLALGCGRSIYTVRRCIYDGKRGTVAARDFDFRYA